MCVTCGIENCTCEGYELSYEGAASEEVPATTTITVQGHPIWMIDEASDIALFDLGTGEGEGIWLNWALCDGQSHTDTNGDTIGTPNLINRFVVGALDDYSVGATGGEARVTLAVDELPVHNHALTDPGHAHTVTIADHTHALTDAGHTHSNTDNGHTHGLTIDPDGSHNHDITINTGTYGTASTPTVDVYVPGVEVTNDTETTETKADHAHQGSTIDAANADITINSATTGVTVNNAVLAPEISEETTGITIAEAGADVAHNNLPPYYALVYIKFIG